MTSFRCMFLLTLSASLLVLSGAGRVGRPVDFDDGIEARLESLDPSRPIEYLELAEDLSAGLVRGESRTRSLARHLYGLAGRIDPDGLGASAALGLASLTSEDRQKARFRAAASLLDGGRSGGITFGRPEVDLATAMEIGEAFGGFRSGRTSRLKRVLEDPTKRKLLLAWEDSLPGGVAWLSDQLDARGRPPLGNSDLLAMIRVELALLDRGRPNWSTLLAIDGDPAMVDLRPDRVLQLLLDDDSAGRRWRRDGEWVADRDG